MNNEIVQPKKKKPVFLIVLLIILGLGCIGGGYYLNEIGFFDDKEYDMSEEYIEPDETEEETNTENQEETVTTKENNEEISLKKLSTIVFTEKDTMKASDMSDLELIHAAIAISTKYVDTITGTEIKEIVKKYFNIDSVNFVDIPCNRPMSEDHDNRMYIYNSKTDKYEINPEHLGHGGSGNGIVHYIINEKETTEGEYYVYSGEIFYVYNGCIWDTCGDTGLYDVYLSYEDASNKTNKQFNAYEKTGLCINNICDNNKIYEEIKDNIKKISFYYKKNNDNYVFDHYEVK